jgi:hypothetical protein
MPSATALLCSVPLRHTQHCSARRFARVYVRRDTPKKKKGRERMWEKKKGEERRQTPTMSYIN